jgi:hypothetical protein
MDMTIMCELFYFTICETNHFVTGVTAATGIGFCRSTTPNHHAVDLRGRATLQIAKEVVPGRAARAGRHPRHLHVQAGLSEAPWVDVIVRGEGEEIIVD